MSTFWKVYGLICVLLGFIVPIGMYFYLHKGSNLFAEDIFLHIANQAAQEPRVTQVSLEQEKQISERVIIRERVKVTYSLPNNCPHCKAVLKYEEVTMKGPYKAECPIAIQ